MNDVCLILKKRQQKVPNIKIVFSTSTLFVKPIFSNLYLKSHILLCFICVILCFPSNNNGQRKQM